MKNTYKKLSPIKLGIFTALSSLSFALSASANTQENNDVQVCLLANAGFHIIGENKSVLIDALIDKGLDQYPKPNAVLKSKIIQKQPPFDTVKAVLSTHYHDDHMGPNTHRLYGQSHPDIPMILPPQSYQKMGAKIKVTDNGYQIDFGTLKPIKTTKTMGTTKTVKSMSSVNSVKTMPTARTVPYIATLPTWSEPIVILDEDGVKVTAYRVSHGNGRPIENIGYLMEVDGVKIFHPGDMSTNLAKLKQAGIDALPVDILLIPYWYALDQKSIDTVNGAWKATTIIPMHFDQKQSGWMDPFGGLDGIIKTSLEAWPNTVKLTQQNSCYSYKQQSK